MPLLSLDSFTRRLHSALRGSRQEQSSSLKLADEGARDAAKTIDRASESIVRFAEETEGLSNSIQPLAETIRRLTATTTELADRLGAVRVAARGVEDAERFLGEHRHEWAEPPGDGRAGS